MTLADHAELIGRIACWVLGLWLVGHLSDRAYDWYTRNRTRRGK